MTQAAIEEIITNLIVEMNWRDLIPVQELASFQIVLAERIYSASPCPCKIPCKRGTPQECDDPVDPAKTTATPSP